MRLKFILWLGVFVFHFGSASTAAMPRPEHAEFFNRMNTELDEIDDVLERELNLAERIRDDEKSKDIQGMQLWVRDLRGDLLKLAPAGEEVWRELLPPLRNQMRRLRGEVADLKGTKSTGRLAE